MTASSTTPAAASLDGYNPYWRLALQHTKLGVNLSRFSIHGTADAGLYDSGKAITGSGNGRPDSAGYILELNYLPRRDIRLVLQFTGYDKFNGARNKTTGSAAMPRTTTPLYLLGWFMF